jgi:hypothetical protein
MAVLHWPRENARPRDDDETTVNNLVDPLGTTRHDAEKEKQNASDDRGHADRAPVGVVHSILYFSLACQTNGGRDHASPAIGETPSGRSIRAMKFATVGG